LKAGQEEKDLKLKPSIAIKEYCGSFEMGTIDYGDSNSFRTGY